LSRASLAERRKPPALSPKTLAAQLRPPELLFGYVDLVLHSDSIFTWGDDLAMPKEKRKKFLVHGGIQMAILRRMLLQWFLFIAIAGLLSFLVQFMVNPFQTGAETNNHFRVLLASQLVASFCLVPLFMADSLSQSNRFVGPIVRLKSYLRSVESNNPTPLSFREGDHWNELTDEVNTMFERLRAQELAATDEDHQVTLASAEQAEATDSPVALSKTDL